jgi:hypothetical protein
MAAGFLLQFQYDGGGIDMVRFVLSMLCLWSVSGPLCQTITVTALTRCLGTRPQAHWIGIFTAAGSVGRILFPLCAGGFDQLLGLNGVTLFALFTSGVSLAAMAAVFVFHPHCKRSQ